MTCAAGCAVVGNTVTGLDRASVGVNAIRVEGGDAVDVAANRVTDVECLGRGRGECVGIWVMDTRNVLVLENTVERLTGRPGNTGDHAGDTVAIVLTDTFGARVAGNTISEIEGGAPAASPASDAANVWGISVQGASEVVVADNRLTQLLARDGVPGGAHARPGYGGTVYGMRITASADVRLEGNTIERLIAGDGSTGGRGFLGETGGGAIGIELRTLRSVVLVDNVVGELRPGAGGGTAPDGPAFGLRVDAASTTVDAGPTNLVSGDPLAFYDGVDDLQLGGLDLRERVASTNLGKVVVRRARGARLTDIRIRGYTAPGGVRASRGYDAVGVRLEAVDDATLADIEVEGLVAGDGGPSGHDSRDNNQPQGPGGDAAGVWVIGGQGVRMARVAVRRLTPGAIGAGGIAQTPGRVYGVRITDATATLHGAVLTSLRGAAVALDGGTRLADLGGLTVYDADAGVHVGAAPLSAVRVAHSIFSVVAGDAIASHADNEAARVAVAYCAFDRVDGEEVTNLTHDQDTAVRGNVRFADEIVGDLTLAADSPCVDAGDPGAACDEEPRDRDGRCRLDLGHTGNTAEARAR